MVSEWLQEIIQKRVQKNAERNALRKRHQQIIQTIMDRVKPLGVVSLNGRPELYNGSVPENSTARKIVRAIEEVSQEFDISTPTCLYVWFASSEIIDVCFELFGESFCLGRSLKTV